MSRFGLVADPTVFLDRSDGAPLAENGRRTEGRRMPVPHGLDGACYADLYPSEVTSRSDCGFPGRLAGDWYFPGYDNNGNVIGYWDETGALVAEYVYDAFGNTISSSGSMASVFPHRFSTKYCDADTDLYYYGYRYYSPSLGRWISRDPIEEDGGINLYAAMSNNPFVYVDPDGYFPQTSNEEDSSSFELDFDCSPCEYRGVRVARPDEMPDWSPEMPNKKTAAFANVVLLVEGQRSQELELGRQERCHECGKNGTRHSKKEFECWFEILHAHGINLSLRTPGGKRTKFSHEVHAHVQNFIAKIHAMQQLVDGPGSWCLSDECHKLRDQYIRNEYRLMNDEELIWGAKYDVEDYPLEASVKWRRMMDLFVEDRWTSLQKAISSGRDLANCIGNEHLISLQHGENQ